MGDAFQRRYNLRNLAPTLFIGAKIGIGVTRINSLPNHLAAGGVRTKDKTHPCSTLAPDLSQ
jgi:hypothetical protein